MERFTNEARPQRVIFGVNAVDVIAYEFVGLGCQRILLIAGGSAKPLGDELSERLDGKVVASFSEVRPHVPEKLAEDARESARARAIDGILTVGGGSATGLGKAVALTTGVPIVAVPTTYAGSELTDIYGITAEHKETGRDPRVLPRIVIYDPVATTGLTPRATGTTGFNALAHAIEAFYAPHTNPLARLHAEEGVRELAAALPESVRRPGDIEVRARALYGAYLAGLAFAAAGPALHHKISHVLGGGFGLVHGEINAVLLPYVVAFNAPAIPDAAVRIARALAPVVEQEKPEPDPARALRALARTLGLPTSLAEIGMPADGLETAAEQVVTEVGTANPRPITVPEIRRLFDDAYAGREPAAPPIDLRRDEEE